MSRWLALAAVGMLGCAEPYATVRINEPVVRKFGDRLVEGQYVSPVAYEQYILAMLATNAGRLDEAVEALRRALGSDSTSAYLRWHLADALLSTGRVDEARDELDTALQLAPDSAEAYVVKSRLRARLGDRPGAMSALERAIQLDPTLEEAYVALAAAQHDAGDDARSLATMRALAANVPSAAAEERLGRAALKARDRKAARAHLQRALDLDGSRIEVRLELARVAIGDGDTELGLSLLSIAAERTRDPINYVELARAAASHGHAGQATSVLDRLEEDAQSAQARLDVAAAFIEIGLPRRALPLARRVIADDRRGEMHAAAQAIVARAEEADGAIPEALAAWQEVTPTDLGYAEAILSRARLLELEGRHAEAGALLDAAIADRTTRNRLDERDQLAVARAKLRALLGEPTQARAQLAKLASERPRSLSLRLGWALLCSPAEAVSILEPLAQTGDPRVVEPLAHARVQTGRHLDQAQHELEKAQAQAPNEASLAAALGEVYVAEGRLDDAQAELELADRLRPGRLATLSKLASLYALRNDRARGLDAVARALASHPADTEREALEALRLQLQTGRVTR